MSVRGVVPPLSTPFRADGELDVAAFEANIESLAQHELGGFLVLGSNGEAASLDDEESRKLVAVARRLTPGRQLLVGTGRESTRATIAATRAAADRGADAVLVLTPHYFKSRMSPQALQRHYEAVADASPVPVYAYSVPAFTGLAWPPELGPALSRHPRIAGIKESSGDLALLSRIVSEVPASFSVLCGNAPVFYPALCLGARAGVLAVANCAPRPAIALYRAFEAGDHDRALRIQRALAPLAAAVTTLHGIAGLKLALDLVGLRGGAVRAPLLPAAPGAAEAIRELLARAEAAV